MARISQEEQEMVARVNALADCEILRQSAEHPRWYRNLCFYLGAQWVWWNKRYNCIEELPRDADWSVRITENHIRPTLHRMVSQIMRNNPQWQAIPVGNTEDDRLAARVWRHFLGYEWDRMQLPRLLRNRTLLWALITGRGWLEIGWNPDIGNPHEIRLARQPASVPDDGQLGEQMQALGDEEGIGQEFDVLTLPEGDLYAEAPSPFNVFLDPAAESFHQARWVMKVTFHHVQEVEEYAGFEPGTLSPDVAAVQQQAFSLRVLEGVRETGGHKVLAALSAGGGTPAATGADGKYIRSMGLYSGDDAASLVAVKRLWVRPSAKAPEGRYIAVAGGRCLNRRDLGRERYHNPYRTLPFVPVTCYEQPGSQFAQAVVDDLYPGQVRLNRLLSNDTAIHNLHRSPQWLVHEQTMIDRRHFNDKPTQIIVYKGPLNLPPPKRVDPPNMAFDLRARYDLVLAGMQSVSSVGNVSQGNNVSGGRSAAVVEVLQRADEAGREIISDNYYDSLTEAGRLVASIAKRFVREDRLIPALGRGGKYSATLFRQAQVERCLDVRVTGEDGLPTTLLGRMKMLLQLAQTGLMNFLDPRDKMMAVRLLDSADLDGFFDMGEENERERIALEHQLLLAGMAVPIKAYDLSRTHIEEHTRWMREPAQQELFSANPDLEQFVQNHVDLHINSRNMNQVEPNAGAPNMGSVSNEALSPGAGGSPASGGSSSLPGPGSGGPEAIGGGGGGLA